MDKAKKALLQLWLALAKNPPPNMLPIVKIGRKYYFADERLKENRNVLDPSDVQKW